MFSEIVFVLFFLFFLPTSLLRRLEKVYIKKIGGVWGERCPIGLHFRLSDDGKRFDALDVYVYKKKAKLRKGRSRRGNRVQIGAGFAANRASADL